MMIPVKNQLVCPLCHADRSREYHRDKFRHYYQCRDCALVFVPGDQHLDPGLERKRYDSHQNSPDDPDYRRFLDRLFQPLSERLIKGSRGLDFGSGPGPTLSVMFEETGMKMRIYDPYYAHDTNVFEERYDFITASEVVEHLRDPHFELGRLWRCLKAGGYLGVMTKRVIGREAFSRWHYKSEPTHICFYSEATFRWLAGQWKAELTVTGGDVVLFRKKEGV